MVDVTYELLKEVIEHKEYLKLILDRYNITNEDYEKIKEIPNIPYNLMIAIGESKNIVKRGNEVDLEKPLLYVIITYRELAFLIYTLCQKYVSCILLAN